MQETETQLSNLFQTVGRVLKENQESLNAADELNHNHGDNMVANFRIISRALTETEGETPSKQLDFASQKLKKKAQSGSAQMYAEGLARAANQLQGQDAITSKNAMSLVQSLLGGGATAEMEPAAQDDLMAGILGSLTNSSFSTTQSTQQIESAPQDQLGELLGSLLGGAASPQQSEHSAGTGSSDLLSGLMGSLLGGSTQYPAPEQSPIPQTSDPLSSLMGALMGGNTSQPSASHSSEGQSEGGLNLNTLFTAGLAYLQANQQGASTGEALVQAVLAGSHMNTSPHHSQSGHMVASTLISTLGNMLSGKGQD